MIQVYKKKNPIDIDRIIRIDAINSYSKIYFDDQKTLLLAKVLKSMEILLDTQQFIRANRKQLVNMNFIQSIHYKPSLTLELADGNTVSISRRRSAKVISCLGADEKYYSK